jgi:hypothetical protein
MCCVHCAVHPLLWQLTCMLTTVPTQFMWNPVPPVEQYYNFSGEKVCVEDKIVPAAHCSLVTLEAPILYTDVLYCESTHAMAWEHKKQRTRLAPALHECTPVGQLLPMANRRPARMYRLVEVGNSKLPILTSHLPNCWRGDFFSFAKKWRIASGLANCWRCSAINSSTYLELGFYPEKRDNSKVIGWGGYIDTSKEVNNAVGSYRWSHN